MFTGGKAGEEIWTTTAGVDVMNDLSMPLQLNLNLNF